MLLKLCQTSIFQTPLQLDDQQYKETIEIPQTIPYPSSTLASYTYYYCPSLHCLFQSFSNDPVDLYFSNQFQHRHHCPLEQLLARASLAMSSDSPIFIPSRSSSPANNESGNSTPYIVTSPPPESITSATTSERAWPNRQMVDHICNMLSLTEEQLCEEFPNIGSVMPINISPPHHTIVIPNTLPYYPGDELANYSSPSYPNSPPSSPEPIPIPPRHSSVTDDHSMAVILYDKLVAQEVEQKAWDADAENQTPSPDGPQPGVHPGLGWIKNWTATNTRHYIVIPNSEEDVMALFICYDYSGTSPEVLATNGKGCQVHSCPLYARATGRSHSPYSPAQELLFHPNKQYTDLIDWAITNEDNQTLKGEVIRFRAHQTEATHIARCIGTLKEALQFEHLAMYQSTGQLLSTNAFARLHRCIDRDSKSAAYFSGKCRRKARIALRDRAEHMWGPNNGKFCDWCSKGGHAIEDCTCLGFYRYCSCCGHADADCHTPHDFCTDTDDCKVYPTHTYFDHGYCAAVNDNIDI